MSKKFNINIPGDSSAQFQGTIIVGLKNYYSNKITYNVKRSQSSLTHKLTLVWHNGYDKVTITQTAADPISYPGNGAVSPTPGREYTLWILHGNTVRVEFTTKNNYLDINPLEFVMTEDRRIDIPVALNEIDPAYYFDIHLDSKYNTENSNEKIYELYVSKIEITPINGSPIYDFDLSKYLLNYEVSSVTWSGQKGTGPDGGGAFNGIINGNYSPIPISAIYNSEISSTICTVTYYGSDYPDDEWEVNIGDGNTWSQGSGALARALLITRWHRDGTNITMGNN